MVRIKPERQRIRDELGRLRTLDPRAFLTIMGAPLAVTGGQTPILLLGIGPEPSVTQNLVEKLSLEASVFWTECPDFAAQMPPQWHEAIPPQWTQIEPGDHQTILRLAQTTTPMCMWHYTLGTEAFSTYWGTLLGSIRAQVLGCTPERESSLVLLPGKTGDLLTVELEHAVTSLGLTPVCLDPEEPGLVIQYLRDSRPALYLSVNLRGLDEAGEQFRLLQSCGVPLAIWMVDNPWHILSSLRSPWWKEAAIFVTDASFIEPLKQHGAQRVFFLPLGAWMPEAENPASEEFQPIVFVGRSSFPDKDKFFAGCHVPEEQLLESERYLHTANPPDVHWWERRLDIGSCWPERAIRQAGWAADTCSALRRRDWLRAAMPLGLTLFGDAGWRDILPSGVDLRPPVDYYSTLPAMYGSSRYQLNSTSLLLPDSLNQRHFDVWTAGGFLLTAPTSGLSIFPEELVEPIRVPKPEALPACIERLEKDSSLRIQLQSAWRQLLLNQHTYGKRLTTIFEILQKN